MQNLICFHLNISTQMLFSFKGIDDLKGTNQCTENYFIMNRSFDEVFSFGTLSIREKTKHFEKHKKASRVENVRLN